tara:strand:+ start:58 stop:204 length:147 start_codon:yes stop_codon:yes gene_type:complete
VNFESLAIPVVTSTSPFCFKKEVFGVEATKLCGGAQPNPKYQRIRIDM